MMFYTNWIMALTAILASMMRFILMFLILGKSQKYFVSRQVELGKLNGHIEEIYSGLNVVKVYNGKKEADRKFDELNKKVYERVFEFIDEEEMASQYEIKKVLKKEEVKGEIEFQNVVFQYDNNDKPTINGFSAKALPGQKVAIVGPTGAGKTTMVNLLMKFYDISSGDTKIDGISTKDLTRENIYDLFTMVLQDTWLFNGTIKENIIYNDENISDEKIKEVCKTVGLDHFIKTLPKGYDTEISDNDSVSAGQRQLLTSARGILIVRRNVYGKYCYNYR